MLIGTTEIKIFDKCLLVNVNLFEILIPSSKSNGNDFENELM